MDGRHSKLLRVTLPRAPTPGITALGEGGPECVSDLMSITPRQPPGGSGGVWVLPDLHPLPAGAHVLAQEEAVERDGPDEEEELLHCLPHELGVQAVLAHGAVEVAQLLQDGGHRVGVRVVDAGRPLAEARGLQAGNALQTLVLQHARHCRGDTQRTFSLLYVPVSGGVTFSTRVSSGCSCDKSDRFKAWGAQAAEWMGQTLFSTGRQPLARLADLFFQNGRNGSRLAW